MNWKKSWMLSVAVLAVNGWGEEVSPSAATTSPTFSQPTATHVEVNASSSTVDASNEVFLSLTRTAYKREKLPTNTTVITSDQIRSSGAQTLSEILEREGGMGIQVTRSATRGSLEQVIVRGFSSKSVVVMVDGRPIRNPYTATIDLSQVPIDGIDRIEIVRGPSSALYGQNAVGGVIQIFTKRGSNAMTPSYSFTQEFGSFDTTVSRLQVSRKHGAYDAFVAYSRNLTDGFRRNSDWDNQNANAILGWDLPDRSRLEVQGIFVQSEVGLPSALNIHPSQYDGKIERQSNSPTDRQYDRDRSVRASYKKPLGDAVSLTTHLFWDEHSQLNGGSFTSYSNISTRKADVQLKVPFGFLIGGEFENQKLSSDLPLNRKTDIWSGYAQHQAEITEQLTTILGLRGDHDEHFGGSVNPRLSVISQLRPTVKVSMNMGRAFRAPTFADIFSPYSPNPDIRPETTWSWDLGTEWKPTANSVWSVTGFHTASRNRIALDSGGKAINLYSAYSSGIETGFRAQLLSWLDWGADYTFTEARGRSTETSPLVDLALVARHLANNRVTVRLPYAFQVRSTNRYIGKKYFPGTSSRTVVPDVFLWDLQLSRKVTQYEVYVRVDNLLNRRYALNANAPGSFLGQYYPEPGRTFQGGISVYFW